MEYKNVTTLVSTTEKKQTQRHNVLPEGRGGEGQYRVEVWELQSTGHKTGSRMYFTICGILPIFYNNCKCKVTFKYCIKIL